MPSGERTVLLEGAGNAVAGGGAAHGRERVRCVVAGVPCQDVSIAGKRAGLRDKETGEATERTGLFYEFARILRELRPDWFVFENVPGLLSSNHGRDFAEVLRVLMVECGYGVSWRVLDSQFFGVAQRRRRLFVVGSFGKPCPAEILFDAARGSGDPAPDGKAWPDIAVPLTSGSADSKPARRLEDDFNLAYTLRESDGHHGRSSPLGDGCDNLVASDLQMRLRSHERMARVELGRTGVRFVRRNQAGDGYVPDIVRQAISSKWSKGSSGLAGDEHHNLVCSAFTTFSGGPDDNDAQGNHIVAYALRSDPGGTGQGHNTTYAVTENMRNRSQGPASYVSSQTDADGVRDFAGLPKGMDSPRYRALGNAVTVQVAEWIARRIVVFEEKSTC